MPAHDAGSRDRYYVLTVLTLAYALNIADRFVIASLIEPIRQEMRLSDTAVGYLTGVALALFYVTVGVPLAVLADRTSRRNILAWALLVWSAMTALCGFATTFSQLMLGRFGVGIGEAGGTAPSTSMLADKFSPARRPLALTIFSLGACLGAWLGSTVAGAAAQREGWQAAFLLLGFPGIALAALVWLTVKEPLRGERDRTQDARTGLLETLRFIRAQRAALHLVIGGSVATLWSWGLLWWTPAFLARSHQLSVGDAGNLLGPMHLVAGVASTLLAAWLMSLKVARDPRFVARLMAGFVGVSTLPSLLAYATGSITVATVSLWAFVPGVYFFIGPVLGLLQNVLPPGMRATGCATLLLLANLGNLMIAPLIVGWLSDWFRLHLQAGNESLRWALLLLAPTGFWGAWHFWRAGLTIRADEARIAGT